MSDSDSFRYRVKFTDIRVNPPADEKSRQLRALIEEMLFRLNGEKGTTLVIVTHDRELADKAAIAFAMKGGRIAETRGTG